MTDWLDRLLVSLREARVDLSAEDVADVVWLAPYLDRPIAEPDVEGRGRAAEAEESVQPLSDEVEDEAEEEPEPTPAPSIEGSRPSGGTRGELHLPGGVEGSPSGGGRPLRAPTGSSLPGSLALSRALRPLRRRVASRTRRVLDVAETVRRIAEEGVWLPALRPARDRWLELSMVLDAGASMGPWRSAATELLALFSSLGAFRSVRVWSLETDSTPIRLRAGLVRQGSARRDPRELVDPTGRSLIVVLTDCVSESWSDGQVARLLEDWARAGPVALLQVLPEHLWTRSALGIASAVRLSATGPASANVRLGSRSTDPWADPLGREGSSLPVASLTPQALSAWARVVAGVANAEVPGYRLDLAPAPIPLPTISARSLTPRERLDRFWSSASPTARRLAGLLAASPAISLPVIRLIRQALLPEARQVHEAEVLLGGLLRITDEPGESTLDPDEVRYDFRDGLRSLLLDAVPAADALEVLGGVSSYVEENLAHGIDFRAMLADPASAVGSIALTEGPFARVAAEVLLRLGGDYARLVTSMPVAAPASSGPVDGPQVPPAPPGRTGEAPLLEDPPPLPGSAPPSRKSFQQKLDRVRRPRVQITYDVESVGGIETRELPFVIGVLADLSGQPGRRAEKLAQRKFIEIDRDNFDEVMGRISPRFSFMIDTSTDDPTKLEMIFRRIEDFSPDSVAARVKLRPTIDRSIASLSHARELGAGRVVDLIAQGTSPGHRWRRPIPPGELLLLGRGECRLSVPWDKMVSRHHAEVLWDDDVLHVRRLPSARNPIIVQAREVKEFSIKRGEQFRIGETVFTLADVGSDVESDSAGVRVKVDPDLTQIREILHHPKFRKLEATWRGLRYLVQETETSATLKIKVLDVAKGDLAGDLEKSFEFDQSGLFARVYEDQFGALGGEPVGLLIGDYEFDHSSPDVWLLSGISAVAAAAHAPFVAGLSPSMFDVEAFEDRVGRRDLLSEIDPARALKWRAFRESEDSRFIGLVVPRLLGRLPYGEKTLPVEDFPFEEWDGPPPLGGYLWMNGAWGFATRVAQTMAMHGWPAAIQGSENALRGLPVHTVPNAQGGYEAIGPVEAVITNRREFELSKAGFISLVAAKEGNSAMFLSTPSCHHNRRLTNSPEASVASRMSSQINQINVILCMSRFVHYLKVDCRDKVGSFMNAGDCERWLNAWIGQYVGTTSDGHLEVSAARPLAEASLTVEESPGKSDSFRVVLFIQPSYQLDELALSLRTVFEIPGRGA
jgi:type VI secretion system protein ImpC